MLSIFIIMYFIIFLKWHLVFVKSYFYNHQLFLNLVIEKTDADELSLLTKYLIISPTFQEFFEILPSPGLQDFK